MLVDLMASTDAYAIADSVTYLAQGSNSVTLDGTLGDPPSINIIFPGSIINIARVASVLAVVGWLLFAVSKFLMPASSGGGGSMLQKIGGLGPLLTGLVAAMVLWDLNNSVTVVNALMRVGYMVWSWLSSGLESGTGAS